MLFGQIGAAEAGRERAAHPVRAAAANQHKTSMPALIRRVPCMTHPPNQGASCVPASSPRFVWPSARAPFHARGAAPGGRNFPASEGGHAPNG